MSDPAVSIIVPHYNDLAGLDRCLSLLVTQTPPEGGFEIVVADNGSPAGAEAVEAVIAGRARLTIATDRGAGPARNAGVAAARGAILAFTDSDCLPKPGWLVAGVRALGRFDLVGGAMRVSVEHDGELSGAEAFERVFAFDNRRYVEDLGFTVTANLFCRREVFERTGPFHVGVPEDMEWCHRAREQGFCIGHAADAIVAHPARPDWGALIGKWRRLNAESYELTAAKPMGRARWAARSFTLPLSIAAHAPRVLRSDALSTARERRRALATLARLRWWRFIDAQRLLLRGR
jgi:glycosyltransferase involved in cell wall biosynthesis